MTLVSILTDPFLLYLVCLLALIAATEPLPK